MQKEQRRYLWAVWIERKRKEEKCVERKYSEKLVFSYLVLERKWRERTKGRCDPYKKISAPACEENWRQEEEFIKRHLCPFKQMDRVTRRDVLDMPLKSRKKYILDKKNCEIILFIKNIGYFNKNYIIN